jgi:outer membrane biosynthesis protein TonB
MSGTAPMLGNSTHQGYALSVMLHVTVIAMAWTGMPFLGRELPEESPLIIDLVPIAEITAAAPRLAPEPEIDPEPTPQTPKPVQTGAPPPSKAMPPPPENAVSPPKQIAEVPPPKVKPRPKPKPPPTKEDDIAFLNRLVKDLDKKDTAKPKLEAQPNESLQPTNNFARTFSDAPTMSELDAIRRHIESHWRIDPGKEGVDELSVEIKINVSMDGTVQTAQIMDTPRYMMDNTFRTFANSARNAVLVASPLPINPNNADAFREMILAFSPIGRIN